MLETAFNTMVHGGRPDDSKAQVAGINPQDFSPVDGDPRCPPRETLENDRERGRVQYKFSDATR